MIAIFQGTNNEEPTVSICSFINLLITFTSLCSLYVDQITTLAGLRPLIILIGHHIAQQTQSGSLTGHVATRGTRIALYLAFLHCKKKIIIITRFRFSCVVLVYTFSAKIWLCQDRPEIAYLVQTFQLLPCVCTRGVYLVPGPYWGWISLVPGTQKVHPWQVHPTPRKVHPLEGVVNSCHGLVSWTSW